MITLDAREYCQKCRWFNPEATMLFGDGEPVIINVSCIYREQCMRVYELATNPNRKEEDKTGWFSDESPTPAP